MFLSLFEICCFLFEIKTLFLRMPNNQRLGNTYRLESYRITLIHTFGMMLIIINNPEGYQLM